MSTINITINIPLLLLFKLGLWRKDQISEKNIFKIKSPGQSRPGQKTFLFLPETVYSLEILKLNFLLRRAVINLIDYWNFLSWLQFLLEKKLAWFLDWEIYYLLFRDQWGGILLTDWHLASPFMHFHFIGEEKVK